MGIGRRLKEARERLGLTQEELGRRVGVTGSAITNYEKETSHPKEPVMYALIDVLGVDPNFLFQDCVKILQAKKEPAELVELKQIYCKKLNTEGRKRLLSHARYLTTETECINAAPPKSKLG